MSKQQLKRIIDRYALAKVEMSWIGNYHPDEADDIRFEYIRARKRLNEALDELFHSSLVPRAVEDTL